MSFLNIMLYYHFSLEAVLQGMAENYPTEKQISLQQISSIDLHHILQLLIGICFLLDYLLFLRFLLLI